MEHYEMNNTTYLVERVFSGQKQVSELIEDRLVAADFQELPLTMQVLPSYNKDGNGSL